MTIVINWLAFGITLVTSLGLLLHQNWRWGLGLLAIQYLAVFWLVQTHWPISMAAAKFVTVTSANSAYICPSTASAPSCSSGCAGKLTSGQSTSVNPGQTLYVIACDSFDVGLSASATYPAGRFLLLLLAAVGSPCLLACSAALGRLLLFLLLLSAC